jgi:5-methylthioadenosine/S-adenosylhomocysteine deaminase
MPNILLQHGDVLTLDTEGRVLRDAAVAISDGTIQAVGETPEDFHADEIVDAGGHIIMPGFYNAHTHSAMTLFRGYAEDLPLDRWLNERIFPIESALTADDVYWGTGLAAVEMIRGGTVGFADHYFHMERVAQVAVESGLRTNLAWCTFGGEEGEIGADLAEIAAFTAQWQGAAGGRIRTMLGPHSAHTCTPQFLARTAAVAARLGVGIHLHLAETEAEVERSLALYDLRPVELLQANGVFEVPVLAAHTIHLAGFERGMLAAGGATAVQCPTTHMKLGYGVTPVPALLADGVNVALGTDGAASTGRLDMFQEARHATLIQKFSARDAKALPGDLALRLATQNGARALGFSTSGEIAPGRAADLILLDCSGPHLRPQHDLVAGVLHAACSQDVSDVMVAGRWLMRKRVLLTLDEERILGEIQRRAERLAAAPLRPANRYPAGEPTLWAAHQPLPSRENRQRED